MGIAESGDSVRSTLVLQRLLSDPEDGEAFSTFAGKYLPRMKRICQRLGIQEADADDICATVLLKFHEKHEFRRFVFRSKDNFNHWLHTVVKRSMLTFLRDRRRKPEAWSVGNRDAQEALERVASQVAHDLAAFCADDLASGHRALEIVRGRVDAKTMRAFQMLVFEERKGAEVAAELEMSPPAVWQARHRVAKMLQQELRRLQHASAADQ